MPDNIFVKIYKNEREIRNFERDSKILKTRVLPYLEKIKKNSDSRAIIRHLQQIGRAIKHLSWSDGSIKKSFPTIPWHLLEQLHIFDRETIVRYVAELKQEDGLNKLASTIAECINYAEKQTQELSINTALFKAKAAHYSVVEKMIETLGKEVESCQEQISILDQEKKYHKNDLQFINAEIEVFKKIAEPDCNKENIVKRLENFKKQLQSLSESTDHDPALTTSIKDIENLIKRVGSKPKKTFTEHIESINLPNALSSIDNRLNGQRKNYQEIEKINRYKVAVEKIVSNLIELKKFIYLGQGTEHIDNLIVKILDMIGQEISVFKKYNPVMFSKIINSLMLALSPENSKLFADYLSNPNSFTEVLTKIVEYKNFNEKEKYDEKEKQDGIDQFALICPEIFLASRVFNGEFKKAHESPINAIKNQLKLLKQKLDEKTREEGVGKEIKGKGKGKGKEKTKGETEEVLMNVEDIVFLAESLQDARRKLILFMTYLGDSSNFEQQDKLALVEKIKSYLNILDQMTNTDAVISISEFNELFTKLDKIGSAESLIDNVEKSTQDFSKEILEQYKDKLYKLFMQIKDSKGHQLIARKYQESLSSLLSMQEHYTKYNPDYIEDKEFEGNLKLCIELFTRLITIASDIGKNARFDALIKELIPIINEGKIPALILQDENILLGGAPCSIRDIILHVNEPKNWVHANEEEWKKNKSHAKLKNDARRFAQHERAFVDQLSWTLPERKMKVAEYLREHSEMTVRAAQIRVPSKKALKKLPVACLFDEKTIQNDLREAHAYLLELREQLKLVMPQNSGDILRFRYYQKLVEYAHYLTDKILAAGIDLDSKAQGAYRLAMLRCISVLGETFNTMRSHLDSLPGATYDHKYMIDFRNKLQHFSTTKTGPADLRYFIEHGAQPDAKDKGVATSATPAKTAKDPYKIYSPLKSMQRILMQLEQRAKIIDSFDEEELDKDLLSWATEYMTTFIGGDLITRLESNQIFLDNFSEVYIDHTIDPLTDVDLGSVLVVLEQVRIYRNSLSHAHLAALQKSLPTTPSTSDSSSDEEEGATLGKQLAAITAKRMHVTINPLSPNALLNERFKPAMQLCWAILMLTDKNRQLRPDLENHICLNIGKFERFFEIEPETDDDMEKRKDRVVAKLTKLVKEFGKSHLSKKVALHYPGFDGEKEKESTNQTSEGLGLFAQYYKKVYKIQAKRCNIGSTDNLVPMSPAFRIKV